MSAASSTKVVVCLYCNKIIDSPEPRSAKRPRRYCDIHCYGSHRRVDSSVRCCIGCGAELARRWNEGSKRWGRRKFCSMKCRVGPLAANWKGGRKISDGYVKVTVDGDYQGEHRVIAAKALGRPLKPNEIVHHIDCDGTHNANNNLLICERGYHKWLHDEMGRRYAQEHFSMRSTVDSAGLLY